MTVLSRIRPTSYRRQGCERLPFPACSGMRVAQLSATRHFQEVREFSEARWDELPAFGPNIVVSPAFELHRWMRNLGRTAGNWRCLDTAIFVLTMQDMCPVDNDTRSMVWNSFGIPLYEIYVAPTGQLLAGECEVHRGWHLQPGVSARSTDEQLVFHHNGHWASTGLSGSVVEEPCECGSPLTLVREIKAQQKRRLTVAAVAPKRFAETA